MRRALEYVTARESVTGDAGVARRTDEGVVCQGGTHACADREIGPILTGVIDARRADAVVVIVIGLRAFAGTEAEEVLREIEALAADHVGDGRNDLEIGGAVDEGQVATEDVSGGIGRILVIPPAQRDDALLDGPRRRSTGKGVVGRRARAVCKGCGNGHFVVARIRSGEGDRGRAVAESERADGSRRIRTRRACGKADGLIADQSGDRHRPALRRAVVSEYVGQGPRCGQRLRRDRKGRRVVGDVVVACRRTAEGSHRAVSGCVCIGVRARTTGIDVNDGERIARMDACRRATDSDAGSKGRGQGPRVAVVHRVEGGRDAACYVGSSGVVLSRPSQGDALLRDREA